ncbi:hypothetical protein [Nocardia inohanensis]|uniref:hypothetical protein n=1 Tax=Nocardia inohanensis TaxID=209246 RepID=UPI00083607B8|nr:hypothetical protein [Nocardia inohanensis]
MPSSETATATSVPATSTGAAATKAVLPTGDSLRRSPGTTFSGCDPDGRDKFSTGEVFDPQTGANLPLPKPTLAAPEQLVKQRCTVAGDPKSLRVVYVLATRTPASGLNAEKFATRIVSFGLRDTSPAVQTPWPAQLTGDINDLWPTNFGFIVRLGGSRLVGFDLATLAPVWDRDDGQIYDSLVTGSVLAREIGVSAGETLVFNSTKDGAEIGRFADLKFLRDMPGDQRGDVADGGGFFVQRQGKPDYGVSYFDAASASLLGPLSNTSPSGYQRSGNLVMTWGKGSADADNYLNVYDIGKKDFVLRKSGADAAGLHLSHVYLAGHFLYIENTDDSPVIDLTTLGKVSTKWKLRPMDTVGGEWTLVSSGHVTNDYTDCFGTDAKFLCYERGELVRSPGGVYGGPWY